MAPASASPDLDKSPTTPTGPSTPAAAALPPASAELVAGDLTPGFEAAAVPGTEAVVADLAPSPLESGEEAPSEAGDTWMRESRAEPQESDDGWQAAGEESAADDEAFGSLEPLEAGETGASGFPQFEDTPEQTSGQPSSTEVPGYDVSVLASEGATRAPDVDALFASEEVQEASEEFSLHDSGSGLGDDSQGRQEVGGSTVDESWSAEAAPETTGDAVLSPLQVDAAAEASAAAQPEDELDADGAAEEDEEGGAGEASKPVEDPEGVLPWVRAVLKQGSRRAGTPSERLTAERLVKEMKKLGLETSVETFKALRTSTWVASVVVCLSAAGYLVVGPAPFVALPLTLLGAALFVARLAGFSTPLVKILPRGVSRSAAGILPGTKDRQRRLYLSAHYDVGRVPTRLHRLVRGVGGPGYWLSAVLIFLGPLLSTVGLITLSEGLPAPVSIVCWVSAAWLLLVVATTVHFERKGRLSEGAVTNASGVAAVLCAARSMLEQPPKSFEVVILFPGAHESGGWGMRHAISAGAKPLGDYHIVVDSVGAGGLACVTKAGFPIARRFTGAVPRVAQKVCAYREFRSVKESVYRQGFLDAGVSARAGRSTLAVMGLDPRGRVAHRHRSEDVLGTVDPACIVGAAKYIEAVVRALDEEMT